MIFVPCNYSISYRWVAVFGLTLKQVYHKLIVKNTQFSRLLHKLKQYQLPCVEVVGSSPIKGPCPVVSLSKKLYPCCLVRVGSRNGFERDFTIKLIKLRALWKISPLVKYCQNKTKNHDNEKWCSENIWVTLFEEKKMKKWNSEIVWLKHTTLSFLWDLLC